MRNGKMNIKKLRTKLGLTQTELAEKLGCRQESISKWENGSCPSYIDKLAELALNGIK
ncbi:MAG TPA: helix-turn-helix transcriptional regulator [Massilibacterium sp.]|nr:helix-turn-helix transcriptional regulator [Massilibacterium sp.]